jgi:hypothetical protein
MSPEMARNRSADTSALSPLSAAKQTWADIEFCLALTRSGHLATKQIVNHLMGSGMVDQALNAVQNGCDPSR